VGECLWSAAAVGSRRGTCRKCFETIHPRWPTQWVALRLTTRSPFCCVYHKIDLPGSFEVRAQNASGVLSRGAELGPAPQSSPALLTLHAKTTITVAFTTKKENHNLRTVIRQRPHFSAMVSRRCSALPSGYDDYTVQTTPHWRTPPSTIHPGPSGLNLSADQACTRASSRPPRPPPLPCLRSRILGIFLDTYSRNGGSRGNILKQALVPQLVPLVGPGDNGSLLAGQ
jgi:hypothetical protein